MLISFSISNKLFYLHTHLDSHGNLVTHSHPYNKGNDSQPLKSHHHSDAALAFLCMAEISMLQTHGLTANIFTDPQEVTRQPLPPCYSSATHSWHSGRAPPVI